MVVRGVIWMAGSRGKDRWVEGGVELCWWDGEDRGYWEWLECDGLRVDVCGVVGEWVGFVRSSDSNNTKKDKGEREGDEAEGFEMEESKRLSRWYAMHRPPWQSSTILFTIQLMDDGNEKPKTVVVGYHF
ncbi:hypothetical protein Tco_0879174 [Tanacetum coccineum]